MSVFKDGMSYGNRHSVWCICVHVYINVRVTYMYKSCTQTGNIGLQELAYIVVN